jgi:hypothetical protein
LKNEIVYSSLVHWLVGGSLLQYQGCYPDRKTERRRLGMNKKIIVIAMVMAFALSAAGLGFAAKLKCTVDGVAGEVVTMTCKKADKLAVGDKVKVSPPKKKAAVEGC